MGNLNDLSYTISAAGASAQTVKTISSVTTLQTADYGSLVVCTGSSAYTVTLPSQSAGKIIDFAINTTSNALITILPASGTINGQASLLYGSNEGCTVYSDGTNCQTIKDTLVPVYSKIHNNGSVSLPNNTHTLLTFNTIDTDQGSFWNTSTNIYTPLYAGKYDVTVAMFVNGTYSAGDSLKFEVVVSGSILYAQQISVPASAGSTFLVGTITVPFLNGSTDTIKINGNGVCTGTNAVLQSNNFYSFCAVNRRSRY